MLRNFMLSSPYFEFGAAACETVAISCNETCQTQAGKIRPLHARRTALCEIDTCNINLVDRGPRRHDPWRCLDCACISGNPAAASWTSAGKSENSCTWRTSSTSLSEAGHRFAHPTASSFDFT